ncbi:MAG: protein kinase, partial [Vicinamibacterales bacterium]
MLTAGSVVGHYTIIHKLGSGGMGDVYLANDTRLGRNVALKILPAGVATDPERRARFEREARAVALLNHPNIVTVHSIEDVRGTHFITMECVAGKTLTTLIPPQGLPLNTFFELVLPIVEAVTAAHQQGVTHRDLKPDNVMVTDDRRVKVLDFGLAKLQTGVGQTTTQSTILDMSYAGQIVGTVAYMSPEQAEGKSVDPRSDIFSLGIVQHQMLTGQRPFTGDSQASIMSAILRDTPPSITDRHPALPHSLARIIKRCLAKDPTRRYQTALDLRNDLEEVRQEIDSGVGRVVSAATPVTSYVPMAAAALVVSALAIAGAVYWLRAPEAGRSEPTGEATFSQLTHEPGQELFPSLSPDGKTVAYTSAANGNLDILAQRVSGATVIGVNLTRDSAADDLQPAFSPDGEFIAFRSERDGGGVFVMGATGESVRRVADFGYHPAWSPDGQQLLCVTQNVTDPAIRFTTSQLWAIATATGAKRLLSEGDAVQPSWSPHGHRIAYWGRTTGTGPGEIWTMPAGGGEPVAVTTEPSMDWNPVWAPDGRHLYFSSDRGGTMNLWRVPIDEQTGKTMGRAEAVTTGVGASSQHVTISSDGRRIVYAAVVETTNLQKVAFDPDAGTAVGMPEWITRGSRTVAQPDASPDGTLLAFNSAGKQEDIFVTHADGLGLQQLTDDAFKDRAARWSPDGRRIAFYSDRTGKYEIWVVNRDGGGLQQLTHSPGAHYPVWSPDGLR